MSWEVQFELGVRLTVFEESPVEEEKLTETGSFDAFQELLGDDLIGIDVRAIHGGDSAMNLGERSHGINSLSIQGPESLRGYPRQCVG